MNIQIDLAKYIKYNIGGLWAGPTHVSANDKPVSVIRDIQTKT